MSSQSYLNACSRRTRLGLLTRSTIPKSHFENDPDLRSTRFRARRPRPAHSVGCAPIRPSASALADAKRRERSLFGQAPAARSLWSRVAGSVRRIRRAVGRRSRIEAVADVAFSHGVVFLLLMSTKASFVMAEKSDGGQIGPGPSYLLPAAIGPQVDSQVDGGLHQVRPLNA